MPFSVRVGADGLTVCRVVATHAFRCRREASGGPLGDPSCCQAVRTSVGGYCLLVRLPKAASSSGVSSMPVSAGCAGAAKVPLVRSVR